MRESEQEESESGSGFGWVLGAVIVVAALILIWIVMANCTSNIKSGYVGVMYDRTYQQHDGILPTPYTQGFVWIDPFTQRMIQYPISMRTVYLTQGSNEGAAQDDSFDIPTQEGQPLNVDINFSYNINPQKAPDLYYTFSGESIDAIEQGFIRANVKSLLMNVSGTYSILGIYGDQRAIVTQVALKQCQVFFAPYGIDMVALNFGAVRPSKDILTSIEQKIQATQDAQTAQAHLAQAKIDAETAEVSAQGVATSTLEQAQAQAKANQLLAASLNSEGGTLVNEAKAIDKWNGAYPTIMGGSGMVPVIQVPGLIAASK